MAFSNVNMKKQNNKEYSKGYQLNEIGGKTEVQCLQRCLENCRCLSFELCNSTICRLQSSSNSSKVKPSTHCNYFEFKQENRQCNINSCASIMNCCLTSINPCKNGGTCLPPRNNEHRFYCACLNGYEGEHCHRCSHNYTGRNCGQKISPYVPDKTTDGGLRCFKKN